MELEKWLNNVRLGAKNDRALIIHGGEASGKNTAARVITKLLKIDNAVRNVSSGDFGDMFFLSRVYNSPLIIVNVIPGDYSMSFLFEHMKSLITNASVRVDRQGKSTLTVPNNMNFILLVSGDVNLHDNDRRYIVSTPLQVINVAIGVL